MKDPIIFQRALLQFHARLSGAFYSCDVTAKLRELSWQPSLWLRLRSSFQLHLLILLNHKCLLVLWTRLTFLSSPHWPCCLCVTWISSHEKSIHLILGQHPAEEYVCGLHHRGEALGRGPVANAHRIYFRSICDQTSFQDWILVSWVLHFRLCFSEGENEFVLRLVQLSEDASHMRLENVFSWSSHAIQKSICKTIWCG